MALPPSLAQFLADMEYPATKDDLLREAARSSIPYDDLMLLEQLPMQSYSARREVALAAMSAVSRERELAAA